ncbi:MAG: hypothetical protein JW938_07585 [Candidatus Omnitrophica bacterium]|nr:hypothetical protein [Candidatus Omnitrophota bacterium]
MNETIVLTTTVSWPEDTLSGLNIAAITTPDSELAELVKATQASSSSLTGDQHIAHKTFTYHFKAKEKGVDTFSPFIIEFKSNDDTTVIKKGDEVEIEVVGYFKRYYLWVLWFLGIMVVIISVFVGIKAFKETKVHAKEKRASQQAMADLRKLEQRTLAKMEEARSYLIDGEIVQYLIRIKDIVVHYGELKKIDAGQWKQNVDDIVSLINKIAYAGGSVKDTEIRTLVRKFEIEIKNNMKEDCE